MDGTKIIEAEEDVAPNVKEIDQEFIAAVQSVTSYTTVGHMECVPTQVLTE